MYFWYKQSGLIKELNSHEPQRTRCFWAQNEETSKNVDLVCLANKERLFSLFDQSGESSFALGERKIKKSALCYNKSAFLSLIHILSFIA